MNFGVGTSCRRRTRGALDQLGYHVPSHELRPGRLGRVAVNDTARTIEPFRSFDLFLLGYRVARSVSGSLIEDHVHSPGVVANLDGSEPVGELAAVRGGWRSPPCLCISILVAANGIDA